MGFFQRIGNALARFMYGRNGADHLGLSMIWGAIALNIVNIFIKSDVPYLIVSTAATVLTFWALFRMFSRNLEKRRRENGEWLSLWWKIKNGVQGAQKRRADKNHKYFTCKNCKAVCRVPVGKGKVIITCPRCGGKIEGKT